ncbi:DsrE family protein [Persephonella sp. KM09-Lau-8]|uniref:DsrE family protein n=1 Tax=Persephonella sp. KM09-Lau-8 TaxID=1158345 RepID=UPI0004981282|nr:DsrE family protein [Persephonella sp. KM09-Lau-8]
MKKFILLIFLFITSLSRGEDEVAKVVIDFRSGDLHIFENYLINGLANNIQYYRDNLKELKVVVVVHGDGYKFFIKNLDKSPYKDDIQLKKKQKELKERLENLVKFYGVRFEMCKAGMKARGISEDNIYSFVKPVYSALVGLVNWQNKGYAYMVFQ